MTRFLARALAGHESDSPSDNAGRLFAYHQSTKHTYQSVRMNARSLDWRNQPNPFRTYEEAPIVSLPRDHEFPPVGTFETMAALPQESTPGSGPPLDVDWISNFLWHSMAVSAWKKIPRSGGRYSLRVNPSSGNLHPTETYLALRGIAGLRDGLYHYRADAHALEFRSAGDSAARLSAALHRPPSQFIVGVTSIFWRESWKYGERAYRYCCHDLGHAIMSLLLAARGLGVTGGIVGHFADALVASVLGITGSDEAPMAFLVFSLPNEIEPQSSNAVQAVHSEATREFAGIPNELSAEEIPCNLLLGMHRSTILRPPAGPVPDSSTAEHDRAIDDLPSREFADGLLGRTVRRRRSALDFDPDTSFMERAELEQLLDFATRDWKADWRGNLGGGDAQPQGANYVGLYVFVHRVRAYQPGIYRWDVSKRTLELLHASNVQRVAAFLSLEQPLAGNACFAVSMIANLAAANRDFGNRGYRYAHFEAGAIGQKLYVGATALGWSATGIGAFYDDDVHRYLGFLPEDKSANGALLPRQVIYHFAVGRAVVDPRLED